MPYDHKDVEQTKRCRYRNEEIAGDDRLSVIAHKRRPPLIATWATRRPRGHVFPYRARRNPDGNLEQKFIGNALLAPERVVRGHTSNQLAQFQRNRPAAGPRLVAP